MRRRCSSRTATSWPTAPTSARGANNTAEIGTTLTAQLATNDKSKGQGTANGGRCSSPELDALLVEASGTMDDAARAALLQKADALAMDDYAILPLHFEVPSWGMRNGLVFDARADQFTPRA